MKTAALLCLSAALAWAQARPAAPYSKQYLQVKPYTAEEN